MSTLLDRLGQHPGVPVAGPLGTLFFVGDPDKTDLPCVREPDGGNVRFGPRCHKTMTPEVVVRPAGAA